MSRTDLDDLDQEIRDHIERETEDNIERGMPPADARDAAIRKFGNTARVKEDARAVWLPDWIDAIGQDVRDGLRRLRRNPGFSIVVVLTLALGIGLSTVAYSVVNAVLVRPLAYPEPERLVWLSTYDPEEKSTMEFMSSFEFTEWRAESTSFERIVAYNYDDVTIAGVGEASRSRIVGVSDGFWEITGARALMGHLPGPSERQNLVLTHQYFSEQFHGDPAVIGKAISMNGQQGTVVGVLPEDFQPQLVVPRWRPGFAHVEVDAYRPLIVQPPPSDRSGMLMIFLGIGQLKRGVTIETARAETEAIHVRMQGGRASDFRGRSKPRVMALQERLVGDARLALWVSLGAVLLVLLITCANVANLLLARASTRQKEIALRLSVGGGPLRVLRQLIAESLVLALLGGIGGIVFANWLIAIMIRVMAGAVPRLTETSIDGAVLAFALAVSVVTAFLFGLGPAIALCRTNVQEVLKDGARTASASRGSVRTVRAVVALQVAMTVVLLSGAGLMLKSLWQMNRHAPGFDPEQILTMRVDFTGPQYRQQEPRRAYVDRVLAQVAALPGVHSAAITTSGDVSMIVFKEGEGRPANPAAHSAGLTSISVDYPRLVGMTLVQGQWLSASEPKGVLINESLARQDFTGVDPIGQRIQLPWIRDRSFATIVGVVADMKYSKIDAEPAPEVFVNYAGAQLSGITIAIRTQGDPLAAAPTIRTTVARVDPTQSVFEVKTMAQLLAESIAPRRFNLLLLGTFASAALLLAVLGIYGVVAYAVAGRTHEIGIRLALGAHRRRVVRMIVRDGMINVIAGVAIGIVAAAALARMIATLLYGVEPTDPSTFGVVTLSLLAIAFLACVVPALKAAVVDPVIALRYE